MQRLPTFMLYRGKLSQYKRRHKKENQTTGRESTSWRPMPSGGELSWGSRNPISLDTINIAHKFAA